MKQKLLAIAITCFTYSAGFSQSFSFGIKAGANLGKISGQAFNNEFSLGYHAGVFATIGLGKKWAIQPEVVFSQVNTDTSKNFSDIYQFNHINHIQLHYLTIPVLLNYNLNKFIAIQIGPQYGILMDQQKSLLQNGKDAFTSGNLALDAGLQVRILKFRVYGRYVLGLSDIDNAGNKDTWQSSTIQLGVGFAL